MTLFFGLRANGKHRTSQKDDPARTVESSLRVAIAASRRIVKDPSTRFNTPLPRGQEGGEPRRQCAVTLNAASIASATASIGIIPSTAFKRFESA